MSGINILLHWNAIVLLIINNNSISYFTINYNKLIHDKVIQFSDRLIRIFNIAGSNIWQLNKSEFHFLGEFGVAFCTNEWHEWTLRNNTFLVHSKRISTSKTNRLLIIVDFSYSKQCKLESDKHRSWHA